METEYFRVLDRDFTSTYGISRKRAGLLAVTSSDAKHINKVIASQAGCNIYFGPWFGDEEAYALARSVARVHSTPKIKFEKADEVLSQPRPDGVRRVRMHMLFPVPAVRLRWSMVRVRGSAKKTPVHERGSQWRKRLLPHGVEAGPRPAPGTFRVRES